MRPKFVVTFLLLVVAVIGAVFLLKPKTAGPAANSSTASADATGASNNASASVETKPAKTASAAANTASNLAQKSAVLQNTSSSGTENRILTEQERTAEIDRLMDLATRDDKDIEALTNIVNALSSSDQHVRAAAIEATKQLGNTNAIAGLQIAANNVQNIDEKMALLDAIKFLSMPMMGSPEAKAAEKADENAAPADASKQ